MALPDSSEDPLFLSLEVPYICDYNASHIHLKFLDIPARHGVDWKTAPDIFSAGLNPEEAAVFLQEWLFFAALNSICHLFEVEFNPMDFVLTLSENAPRVTGLRFHKYVCLWTGGVEMGLYSSTIDRLEKQRQGAVFVLNVLEKTTQAWIEREDSADLTNLDLVLLSIVQLADHLRRILRQLVQCSNLNRNSISFLKSYPRYGRELLLKAGWCFGELPALTSRYTPSTLLYLSTLKRTRDGRIHNRCRADACIASQLDEKYYKPTHSPSCPGPDSCQMVHAPIEKICGILEAGNIPLLSLCEDNHLDVPLLQVETFPVGDKQHHVNAVSRHQYVAISHVWSDGMGNPERNALHACQLRRIQHAVNGLYPTETDSATKNQLFWMDTLCVPLVPKVRSLAIIRMARTFLHADKVPVMDNWLMEDSISRTGTKRMLFKIVHSDWNTRIWTLHEAVLARQCYFQFADAAFTLDQLGSADSYPSTLEVVSTVLSEIEEDKLLSTKFTLSLLRALAHVDPLAIERTDHINSTVPLNPQDDPNQELDRLIAGKAEDAFKLRCNILERCFPILDKADCTSESPEADIHRLTTLIYPMLLDPVSEHVSVLTLLIRGFRFEFIMDRSDDLKNGNTRQLVGIKSKPSDMLAEIAAAVHGRRTSWKEDETICLGGIIGLDVSSIASIRVDPEKREEEEKQVCEERMKRFLSNVRKLPESILFWPSKRLTEYPWRWAPVSFLDGDGSPWLLQQSLAECTDEGLLVPCHAITLSPNQYLINPDTEVIRLRYKIGTKRINRPYGAISPSIDRIFGDMLLEFRTVGGQEEEISWHGNFAKYKNDLVLLKTSNINDIERDAVLVRVLGTKNDTFLVSYIMNVRRVHRKVQDSDPCVNGVLEPNTKKWCVG